jgi:hypothetical protein
LYAALGAVVAHSVQARGVRFYENGIVSLNLPIASEAIRARASRTTHPLALHLLSSLCAAVTESNFTVDNPYRFKTKAEVVESLATHQAAQLIPYTCSCSHSMFQSKTQRHCGRCSQCIDRRFATIAAGLASQDHGGDYVSDVFVGPRQDPLEKAIAVDYTRHGIELDRRSETDLAATFNAEIGRAVRYEANRTEAAQKIISMHKRHGRAVTQVLEEKVHENAANLIDGTLNESSLLALAIGQKYFRQQFHLPQEASDQARVNEIGNENSFQHSTSNHDTALVELTVKTMLSRMTELTPRPVKPKKKAKSSKRDVVIFAAILRELKSNKYCSFLQNHGVKPRWEDFAFPTYSRGYQAGNPWRKKIQDEKTRAKTRMKRLSDPELADLFNFHLPDEFEELTPLLYSRNSRRASKNPSFT